jgi:hypothetical protein
MLDDDNRLQFEALGILEAMGRLVPGQHPGLRVSDARWRRTSDGVH